MPWRRSINEKSQPPEVTQFLQELCTRVKFAGFTWNPPNVPAGTQVATTLTAASLPQFTGLRAGMPVFVTAPAGLLTFGLSCDASCGTDDTLTIRIQNATGGDIDLASGAWAFFAVVP